VRLFNFLKKYYVLEIAFLLIMLYLFGSFVHLSFSVIDWSIITRVIIGTLVIIFLIFTQYLAAMKASRT